MLVDAPHAAQHALLCSRRLLTSPSMSSAHLCAPECDSDGAVISHSWHSVSGGCSVSGICSGNTAAAAAGCGSATHKHTYLEQHVSPNDRVILPQSYSPRVRLWVLLPGVEVARVGLAEQLHFQALGLRVHDARDGSTGSEALSVMHRLDRREGERERERRAAAGLAVRAAPWSTS